MNIIEHISDDLQRAVQKRSPPPVNPMDLWIALQDSGGELTPGDLRILVQSMPRRFAILLRRRGGLDTTLGMISEPSRPEGPLVIGNIEADSVHLSWKPPLEDNGGPIQGYLIEAKDVLHLDVRKTYVWCEGQGTECLVWGLETSHIYQFRVYAQNEAGRSEGLLNKSLVRIKAKSKKPPRPSKPTAETHGEDSVLLQWTVPEDSENLNFVIERFEATNGLWFPCNHALVIRTSYLVTGLNSDREYSFRVSSENAHGVSRPSEASDPVAWTAVKGEAPSVTTPIANCFVKSHHRALFICEYTGTQPIQVTWTKDDIRVREGFGSVIKTDDSGKSELQLHEVDSDDDDCTVRCSLQNSFGKVTSEAAIGILSVPKLGYPSSYKKGLTFDCGDSLRLRVTGTGKPLPVIEWYFNGDEKALHERMTVIRSPDSLEILIHELTAMDSGHYKFVACNDLGEDSVNVEVIITGPPDPPGGFPTFEIEEGDEVLLNWNMPLHDGGSEIFNYVVEKNMLGALTWSRFGVTHRTSLSLGHPDDIEDCAYRIRAINVYGTSDASGEALFRRDRPCVSSDTGFCVISQSHDTPQQQDEETISLKSNVTDAADCKYSETRSEIRIQGSSASESGSESRNFCRGESVSLDSIKNDQVMLSGTPIEAEHLIAPLLENLQISCPEVFCELHNVGCERVMGRYCLVPEPNHTTFYTICSSVVTLEAVNTLPQNDFTVTKCFCAWILHENFLEVSESFCYDHFSCWVETTISAFTHFSQIHLQSDTTDKRKLCGYVNFGEEKHSMSFEKLSFLAVPCETVHTTDAILVSGPPLVFEDVMLCDTHIPQKQHCQESFIHSESITVMVNTSVEILRNFISSGSLESSENAIYRTQSSEDVEGLISMCSVPVRTWKPAMSVLPIKKQVQAINLPRRPFSPSEGLNSFDSNQEIGFRNPLCQETGFLERAGKHLFNSTQGFASISKQHEEAPINPDEELLNVLDFVLENEEKTELTTKANKTLTSGILETVLGSERENKPLSKINEVFHSTDIGKFDTHELDIKSIIKSDEILPQSMFKSKQENQRSSLEEPLSSTSKSNWVYPNWLCRVSPYSIHSIECRLQKVNVGSQGFGSDLKAEERIIAQPDATVSSKRNFKEKSVLELLQLAEEVERSFSQKTEQIESLECILHQELRSLEKDLEVVNEIHKSLDSSIEFLDSYSVQGELVEDSFIDRPTFVERDLMEFTEDVLSCMPQVEFKPSEYPPKVVTHLQNKMVQCGCRTRLFCSIMGDPDPEIVWMKNNKPLPQSSRYIYSNLVEFGVYLDIFNAKFSDSGEYACVATNRHGSADTRTYLQVVGHPEISPDEPKFLKSPDDVSRCSGEPVVMEWKIKGSPTPHVAWFKNAEKLQTDLRRDTFNNHRGCCRLVLRDVRTDDSAIYTCYLENEAGSAISTVLLTVTDTEDGPENIQRTCENHQYAHEETIDPETQSDTSVSEERFPETFIRKKSSFEKHLRVKKMDEDLPGPPFALNILSSGQTWTILTWSAPLEGSSRLEYLVERRLLSIDHWREVGRTYNTLYTAHGLKRGRCYVFRVSAGNSNGWGLPVTMTQPVHVSPR